MSRETTDVVIVGAGIMGLATAYQITRRCGLRVLVVEKGAGVAEGSTGASSSIIRQRYTHREVVRLARGGLFAFRNWSEFTGLAQPRAAFHHTGVLWMLGETRVAVETDRDRLRAEGVEAVVLDGASVRERFPALSTCGAPLDLGFETEHVCADHDAFLFEADGGYFDPVSACQDLLDAARRDGAVVRFHSTVTGVRTADDRVVGVDLADGTEIDAGLVINAAGPWCNRLNTMAGVEVPWQLVPTRVQVLYRPLPPEVPRPLPVVADASSGLYFRPEAGGQQILAGSIREEDEREATDPDSYNRGADRSFLDTKIHGLHHRIPSLPHTGTVTGIAGLYTVNRDDVHPIIGPTPLDGFAVMNGFSGHGFKLSLMCASMMAQWVSGEKADFDTDVPIDFLSVDRDPIPVADKNVLA